MTCETSAWTRACNAADLLAIDPAALGGIWLRARAGPVRDLWLERLRSAIAPRPSRRLGATLGDDALFGGIDMPATLAAGAIVRTRGLIANPPSVFILPSAERISPAFAGKLAKLLNAGHALVALDESAEPDEGLSSVLADRLGMCLDLTQVALGDCGAAGRVTARRPDHSNDSFDGDTIAELTLLCARLGIASLRVPGFAIRAARLSAAIEGRRSISECDLCRAVELVVAPRAICAPDEEQLATEDPGQPAQHRDAPPERRDAAAQDLLLEAARAVLPAAILDRNQVAGPFDGRARDGQGGARKISGRRGRPLPARIARPRGHDRIDLIATLRAAAPWQPIRRAEQACDDRWLLIRPSDIRIFRYEERSDRLIVIVVDASGSTAHARLAEAKGAVEILLGEAYLSRNHVALVAFRGDGAEVQLPPTRSLVQARRRLGGLAGGGATPLARGLMTAHQIAETARKRGLAPTIALLSDGRANVALDGRRDRRQANEDAITAGQSMIARQVPATVIDVGVRREPFLRELAGAMGAQLISLPRADSYRISASVGAALSGRK